MSTEPKIRDLVVTRVFDANTFKDLGNGMTEMTIT